MRLCLGLALVGFTRLIPGVVAGDRAAKPADARVVAAWAAGPFEARIAFDRPIGAGRRRATRRPLDRLRRVAADGRLQARARRASADSRGSLRVVAARLDDDGRTLVLTTDPHPRAATYTLDLPIGGPEVARVDVRPDGRGSRLDGRREGRRRPRGRAGGPSLDPAAVAEDSAARPSTPRALATARPKGQAHAQHALDPAERAGRR